MEKRVNVRAVRVHLICDECGEGEMVVSGVARASIPPEIQHRCSKCRAVEWIKGESYPRIEYEEEV